MELCIDIHRLHMTKKVNVSMSDESHRMLKLYATAIGKSMSDVVYDATHREIHQHAESCPMVSAALSDVEKDKRASKACWGWKCRCCKHQLSCRTGLYKGFFEIVNEYISAAAKDPRFCTYDPLTDTHHHYAGHPCRSSKAFTNINHIDV